MSPSGTGIEQDHAPCEIIEEIVEEIGAGRRHGLDQDPEHNDQPESDLIDAAPET